MKTQLISLLTCAIGMGATAQPLSSGGTVSGDVSAGTALAPSASYSIVEQGPHSRVWRRSSTDTNAPGGNRSYVELGTGMAHLVGGQWVPSSDQIQITAAGAQATNSQHRLAFLGNINSVGAVDLTTPDGKRLISNILGLSYFDQASGASVFVAETKDSNGQLLPSGNAALYPDAMTGVEADVLYENSILGMEQLVVLRQQLPSPTEFGFNPASTLVEVITEFDASAPQVTETVVGGVIDDYLDWGVMQMGRGAAFAIGAETNKVRVTKRWVMLDSRTCLVEQVPFAAIQPMLQDLPAAPAVGAGLQGPSSSPLYRVAIPRVLPERRLAKKSTPGLKLAALAPTGKGVVLDYTTLTSQTNLVCRSDTTYYVNATVNIAGTFTAEGNTVLKFAVSPSATIIASNMVWSASSYRPVVFTAQDDNTAGEQISGSTGNPSANFYGNIALDLSSASNPTVSNARFCYLSNAVAGSGMTLQDVQFVQCWGGIVGPFRNPAVPTLYNVLVYKVNNFVSANCLSGCLNDNVTAENITAHYCTNFLYNTTGVINLTNCLFVSCATNWLSPFTYANSCAFLNSDAGVFQTVGGAGHYLTDNSPYRNAGTTNINATLLADLQRKTTYPPIVYSNATIAAPTTFGPQAQRDTDAPDLGYHYDPLDYAFGGTTGSANLTFTPGTAVGWFRTSSGWYHAGHGIHIADTMTVTFNGTVTAPDYWVRCSVVQEGCNGLWQGGYGPGGLTGWAWPYITNSPQIFATFTRFSMLAGDMDHYRDDSGWLVANATSCEFYGTGVGYYNVGHHYTNCLFDRASVWLDTNWRDSSVSLRNCTIHGANLLPYRFDDGTNAPVVIRETACDGTSVSTSGDGVNVTYYDYNAFLQGASRTTPTGLHDQIVTNFNWQTSYLGRYYLPTNSSLINTGGVTANLIGLYHYTTQTNQVKETNSVVDISYHYVALTNGVPIDTDGDGLPDYFEDTNGDGVYDAGDLSNWQVADTDGDGVNDYIEYIQGRNPRVAGANADTNSLLNLKVYTPLK